MSKSIYQTSKQKALKYVPLSVRILSIIKHRTKIGLTSTALELHEIIKEDIYLSRFTVYYHLKDLEELNLISYEIKKNKKACNKPTKYYFCKNKK